MRPIPYVDITATLKEAVRSLDIVKQLENNPNDITAISVVSYSQQPSNNQNFIGIGLLNDKGKPKDDTFETDAREYVYQVSVMFKMLGEFQYEMIEKLTSLWVLLLKKVFRTSDSMICSIYERDEHGDIVFNENNEPVVLDTVDLREIVKITDITPIFGTPEGDGFIMYLRFNVDEEDEDLSETECFKISQNIMEVLVNVEKEKHRTGFNQLRGLGYQETK